MRQHFIDELINKAEKDNRIMLLVGDLGFNVVERFSKRFPDRFVNCGIAEQNMLSMAAGLALEGNKVFVYSIGNFHTLRCMEQIRNDVCYNNADVKIVAVGGGFTYGAQGFTHHTTEEVGALRTLPNMYIYLPADASEVLGVMDEICTIQGPCYMRLGGGTDAVFHEKRKIYNIQDPIPVIEDKADGSDCQVIILSTGMMLGEGLSAAKLLMERDINLKLYSCPRIKPINSNTILKCIDQAPVVVTLEEHNIIGGLGSAVAEVISENPCSVSLIRVGLNDEFSSVVGNREYLHKRYKMDAVAIVGRITELL